MIVLLSSFIGVYLNVKKYLRAVTIFLRPTCYIKNYINISYLFEN